jgi:formylmethanofuran dehydrogenase subunit E-like metal-binding protein
MLSVAGAAYEEEAMESVAEAAYIDVVIGVTVGFEYPSDGNIINPHITVKDEGGNSIVFNKRYNLAYRAWEVSFKYPGVASAVYQTGGAEGSVATATYGGGETVATAVYTFRVTVSAPGYEAWEQEVEVRRDPARPDDPVYYGNAAFNLRATPGYRLGREITRKADGLLNFGAADGVLCITTAGSVHYQGNTSEDVLEGILNEAYGTITFGQGNLLMLRKTRVDPIDFAFVVKKGTDLRLAYFKNGSLSPAYVGTISQNMSSSEWATVSNRLGSDAFPIASLANAWAIGLSSDILRGAAFHGHVCLGTISGYAMIETLLKYYPPVVSDTGIEATSYKVLGVPGGSDDDVFIYAMDSTPGKRAYVGFNTTDNENMVGFLRWNSQTKTGTLVIMEFDREALAAQFTRETGLVVVEDTLTELKFNAWLVNRLKDNPASLVRIVKALDGLNQEQCDYLTGGVGSTTVGTAGGLDWDYINGLGLPEASPAAVTPNPGGLTLQDIRAIGVRAAELAGRYFGALGIQLEKDDPHVAVLTSAGYVRLAGLPTDMTWDGIYDVLGSRISRKTLLPVHGSLWGRLWFAFVKRGSDGQTLHAMYLEYDPVTKRLVRTGNIPYDEEPTPEGAAQMVRDIGPAALNDPGQLNQLKKMFGDRFNNVQTIANVWRIEAPFDALLVFLFHNHACPGVSPSFLIADYVFQNYPLGEDEKYIYITTTTYCKEDGLIMLLGLSPGAGTYFNLRLAETETNSASVSGAKMEGILIRWNEKTGVGEAVVITFKWPTWDLQGLVTQEARREAQIAAFQNIWQNKQDAVVAVGPVLVTEMRKLITESELRTILSGALESGNVLRFIAGLPDRTLSDLLPSPVPTPVRGGGSGGSARLVPVPAEAATPEKPIVHPEEPKAEEAPPTRAQEGPPAPPAPSGSPMAPPAEAATPAPAPAAVTAGPTPGPEPGRMARTPAPAEAAPTPSPAPAPAAAEEPQARAYEVEREPAPRSRSAASVIAVVGVAVLVALGAAGYFLARRKGV